VLILILGILEKMLMQMVVVVALLLLRMMILCFLFPVAIVRRPKIWDVILF